MGQCANPACNLRLDRLPADDRGVIRCLCRTEYTLSKKQIERRRQMALKLGGEGDTK